MGLSSSSADCVASGMSSPSDSRTGARSGRLMSWAAEIAARQSFESTSVTTAGRVSREREGYVARATPAASAIGSAPPTRVVFFVAKPGKPRL